MNGPGGNQDPDFLREVKQLKAKKLKAELSKQIVERAKKEKLDLAGELEEDIRQVEVKE